MIKCQLNILAHIGSINILMKFVLRRFDCLQWMSIRFLSPMNFCFSSYPKIRIFVNPSREFATKSNSNESFSCQILNFFSADSFQFRGKFIFPSRAFERKICATPTASPLNARKLKFRLPESFRPTWCPAYSEFWNWESLGYLPYKFRKSDWRTVQKFGCASQEKQERQKFCEYQSICNMWKIYTRPTCASDFYFHHIWNIMKVSVSHQKFWKIVLAQIMFFTDKKS
jgi:hypothetical protein